MPDLLPDRLQWLEQQPLRKGSHKTIEDGLCVMEAVAYVAGEPHSYHPNCTCPIITSFMIKWNDNLLTDADRNRLLKGLVPKLVGTRSTKEVELEHCFICDNWVILTKEVELKRCYMWDDWLIRWVMPAWMKLVPSVAFHAEAVSGHPEISSPQEFAAITAVIENFIKINDATLAAAWTAASDDTRAAARIAASDASRAIPLEAALDGACTPVMIDAIKATRAAIRVTEIIILVAALTETSDAIKLTVEYLQQAAINLVERMIEIN